MHILDTFKEQGFSFFNTGSPVKKITKEWKTFQDRYPTDREIEEWKRSKIQNYAVVCGKISDLFVVDVDPKNGGDPTPFQNRGFFEVKTQSGGRHFYFKYTDKFEKTKHNQKGILKGCDLQSTGALIFLPGCSFGPGKDYTIVHPGEIKELPEDLELLMLEALEPEIPKVEVKPYKGPEHPFRGRPGDIFNEIATWEQILTRAGWEKIGETAEGKGYWRRPGKKEGISATTNYDNTTMFYPFTTSTEFEARKGYSKFAVFAHLFHNADYSAAARSLVADSINYKIANDLL
jgi:hypothetical protein